MVGVVFFMYVYVVMILLRKIFFFNLNISIERTTDRFHLTHMKKKNEDNFLVKRDNYFMM